MIRIAISGDLGGDRRQIKLSNGKTWLTGEYPEYEETFSYHCGSASKRGDLPKSTLACCWSFGSGNR